MNTTENAMLQVIMKELASDIHLAEVDIRQREDALQEKRIALRVLQQKAQASQSSAATGKPASSASSVHVPGSAAATQRRPEFMEAFRLAVNSLKDEEIYVAPVFTKMVELGVEVIDERKFRLRIGTELARLEERGPLKKTKQGGGNVPSRYRLMAVLSATTSGGTVDMT